MELVSILLSTCFFSLVSSQYTYWVDDASCRPNNANDPRRANFDAALAGAIDLAARGYARLQSATDVDMKTNFNNVFQTDYGADPNAVGQVNGNVSAEVRLADTENVWSRPSRHATQPCK